MIEETHIASVGSGSYPQRRGNRIRPLIGGEHAFRRICEAVESAQKRVFVTVAFLDPALELPDGRGHLFDVLDRAARRGLDVRALFWRSPEVAALGTEPMIFHGTAQDHDELRRRDARFLARWDRLDKTYCQHQKSWLIDAAEPGQLAFVGGINLDRGSMTSHPFAEPDRGHTQDIYVELEGPVVTDVHHNFVQRWNGASERSLERGAWPSGLTVGDLDWPDRISPEAGDTLCQLTRTIRRGFYADATPTPGGEAFPIEGGEQSVFQQYLEALDGARQAVYLENQGFAAPELVDAVAAAVERGVEVAVVVPGQTSDLFRTIAAAPHVSRALEVIADMGERPNFLLAALAANRDGGRYQNIYVHTKAALVDDEWATIGSTNLANRSFFGDSELNASFWGRDVGAFRAELLSLHHGSDLGAVSPRDSLKAFAATARENRGRMDRGEPLDGFAFALDPRDWTAQR